MPIAPHEADAREPENRRSVLWQANAEHAELYDDMDADPREDTSTASGFTWRLLTRYALATVLGFVIAFLIVGPTASWAEGIAAGIAGAVILPVCVGLMLASREDGRVAERVDDHRAAEAGVTRPPEGARHGR